jgi:hypothetical protein
MGSPVVGEFDMKKTVFLLRELFARWVWAASIDDLPTMKRSAKGRVMSRFGKAVILLLSLTGLGTWSGNVMAAVCTSGAGAVNWSAVATWSCGHVPANADDVVIAVGSTTTQDVSSNSLASLTVNGILTVGNNGTARALTVVGNIAVLGTVSVGATAATHTLTAGGNITNTGTINLRPTATRVCNVTFNRNGNQTVSGAGAYTFNLITLNMGATNANILDMQSAMTVPSPFLTITNGTYKHSNASNITPWTADPAIPATGGFWLASAATVSTGAFNVTVNGGLFRIDSGTINVGNAVQNMLNLGNFATTSIVVNGGTLTAFGGINSLPLSAPNGSTGAGSYTQTGGTVIVSTCGCTIGNSNESFMLGSNTTFTMSGGTIIVRDGNASSYDDVNIQSSAVNVTGGTFQFGDALSTSGNGFLLVNSTGLSVTVWNFVTSNTNGPSISLGTTLSVLNNLTIGTGSTLTAVNMLNTAVSNSILMGGTWTNNSIFTQGTGTVTFTGTGATAAMGGAVATTFNNLTINKASNNVAINSASAALSPTVNGTLTLTSGDVVTTVGTNDIGIGTAGTLAGGSATSYVAGSLQKNYLAGAALNYTAAANDFPVGDATNYTPVNITAGTTTTAGSLTVSTLTPDHPQVTTPIASTGIDAANSVNRYWRFNNAGLTVGTALSATFTFVAGDVDASANTANFIVQRYDGANWNPTAPVAANPLNTQVANITPLAVGNNDFAIGDPLSGFNGNPGAFNTFETTASTTQILGRIFTKLAGTPFTLSIVAVSNNARNPAPATTALTVDVIDASPTGGTLTASSNCRTTWTTVIQTQTVAAPIAWTSGRVNVAITAPTKAVRNARIRVTQGALQGCSTDNFALRPAAFTISSSANNNTTGAGTTVVAGANFSITAQPVISDLTTAITVGYDGTPSIDNGRVGGSPIAGALGGNFGAASGGAATGSTFTYSEVGNFGLNASTSANAVYDNSFTSVDQPNDCTNDFSFLVGGKYGCNFGSTAATLIIGTSGFGRFIPDHFSASPAILVPRSDVVTTTGTISVGSTSLTVASAGGISVGNSLLIIGAGAGGTPLQTTVMAVLGATVTLAAAATTAVSLANVYNLSAARDIFTYMGEPVLVTLIVRAYNTGEVATTNYAGAYAKLNALPTELGTGGNWFNTGCAAPIECMGLGAVSGSAGLSNRLAIDTTSTSTSSWSNGVGTFTAYVDFNRSGSPDGPFSTLQIGAMPQDSDGVTLPGPASADTAHKVNFDATTGNTLASNPDGINERRLLFATAVRYGRLRLFNAYGSELLDMRLPLEADYYNGTGWIRNTDDNMTKIANPRNDIAVGNCTVTLSCATGGNLDPATHLPATAVTLSGGTNTITLTKPTCAATCPTGSLDFALTLGLVGTNNNCVTSPAALPNATNGASLPWLQFAWCIGKGDPNAHATFGEAKNRFIYLRERY